MKTLNILLWIAQFVLALPLVVFGGMKLFLPVEQLGMLPWAAEHPFLVRFTGFFDVLGGLGLLLPALFRIKPQLTPVAAIGCTIIILAGAIFHIMRNEAHLIGMNIIFAALGLFIAWGRFGKAHIHSR